MLEKISCKRFQEIKVRSGKEVLRRAKNGNESNAAKGEVRDRKY